MGAIIFFLLSSVKAKHSFDLIKQIFDLFCPIFQWKRCNTNDEGSDDSYDYIKIIENIYENAYSFEGKYHLSFEILNID